MQVLTFKYTDAKKKVTERTLVAYSSPQPFYAGTDISELEPAEQTEFVNAARKAREKYLQEMTALADQFDLNYRYRQFKPENMANITLESI